MANTYTKVYIHMIFVVKYREGLIHKNVQESLHKYLTAFYRNERI